MTTVTEDDMMWPQDEGGQSHQKRQEVNNGFFPQAPIGCVAPPFFSPHMIETIAVTMPGP